MKGFIAATISVLAAAGSVAAAMHHKRIDHPNAQMSRLDLSKVGKPDDCGHMVQDDAAAVHISSKYWRDKQNCGQWMKMTKGKTVEWALVTGQCKDCADEQIATSPAVHGQFEKDPKKTVNGVTWKFEKMGFNPP
ncbi:hypothetical protein FRC09_011847, partial [Ceratobasidium sp. 395]